MFEIFDYDKLDKKFFKSQKNLNIFSNAYYKSNNNIPNIKPDLVKDFSRNIKFDFQNKIYDNKIIYDDSKGNVIFYCFIYFR